MPAVMQFQDPICLFCFPQHLFHDGHKVLLLLEAPSCCMIISWGSCMQHPSKEQRVKRSSNVYHTPLFVQIPFPITFVLICFLSRQRSETDWHYERWSKIQIKLETVSGFLSARQNIESGHRQALDIFVLSTWCTYVNYHSFSIGTFWL